MLLIKKYCTKVHVKFRMNPFKQFLNLSIIWTLDQIILCCGGVLSIVGYLAASLDYRLDASSTPHPLFLLSSNILWQANSPSWEHYSMTNITQWRQPQWNLFLRHYPPMFSFCLMCYHCMRVKLIENVLYLTPTFRWMSMAYAVYGRVIWTLLLWFWKIWSDTFFQE